MVWGKEVVVWGKVVSAVALEVAVVVAVEIQLVR
jgi:hypothetical protein